MELRELRALCCICRVESGFLNGVGVFIKWVEKHKTESGRERERESPLCIVLHMQNGVAVFIKWVAKDKTIELEEG